MPWDLFQERKERRKIGTINNDIVNQKADEAAAIQAQKENEAFRGHDNFLLDRLDKELEEDRVKVHQSIPLFGPDLTPEPTIKDLQKQINALTAELRLQKKKKDSR